MYSLYMLIALVQGGDYEPVAVYRNAAVCEHARTDRSECRRIVIAPRYSEGAYFVVKPLGDGSLKDKMIVLKRLP